MFTVVCLVLVVVGIILGSTALKTHPFLLLLLAGVTMGFCGGLDSDTILAKLTEGFGSTLQSIGIIIACGTIIGTFLERSGATQAIADAILKKVGEQRAPLAMNLTGFVVSIPVFCDSGFVILSALNKAIARKTGIGMAVLAVALAAGLYTTHVFIPPTPGPLAAAAALGADLGKVIGFGLIVAIPTTLAGLAWAQFYCSRFQIEDSDAPIAHTLPKRSAPSVSYSLTPLLLPILLISLKSIADYPTAPFGEGGLEAFLSFVGHPVIALLIGVFLSFGLKPKASAGSQFDWVADGLKSAGTIILITGAGGAFGNILRATDLGDTLGGVFVHWKIGIILPFLIAAVLKTAQGSSTVAIITTAALVAPLLPAMGLDGSSARALVVLAIGAGAMTVSHVNDSYFWVVSQFSNLNTPTALKTFSVGTLLQGFTGIVVIGILSWIFV